MRKNLLILLLISMAVFTACAQSRKTTTTKKTEKPAAAGTAALKGLTSVAMRRGACFGRCPEYVLTISSNGIADYTGTRNADPMGVYQKAVGTTAAQELLKEFMEYRADTCKDLYTANIADLPGLHFTLMINGKKKIINNANFGPEFLITLSDRMDAVGKVDGSWKKIADKAEGD